MITSFFKPKRKCHDDSDNNTDTTTVRATATATATTTTTPASKKSKATTDGSGVKALVTPPKLSTEVLELISHLNDDNDTDSSRTSDDNTEEAKTKTTTTTSTSSQVLSWKLQLEKHFTKPSFHRLATYVQSQRYVGVGCCCFVMIFF
jgi:hypothetical protein